MKIVKMETHMLSQKVIANVTPEFARVYNIPEGHTSVGFFSADNDDIGYLAVDDASKKANISPYASWALSVNSLLPGARP